MSKYNIFLTLLILLLVSISTMILFGQRRNKVAPVSGQHVRKRAEVSPIQSTELKSLSTTFFIEPLAYNGAFRGKYSLKLEPDEAGYYLLSCNQEQVTVGPEVLKDIHQFIVKYNLEKQNGLYDVTAGLPVEYQAMHFNAEYVSGEKLKFEANNDPEEIWQIQMFRYFRSKLLEQGNTKYALPSDYPAITRLIFEYSEGDGIVHKYGNLSYGDYTNLYRNSYRKDDKGNAEYLEIKMPEGHYDQVNALVEQLGLQWFLNMSGDPDKIDPSQHRFYYIYANSDEQNPMFSSLFVDAEITDEIEAMMKQLLLCIDKPFDNK